MPKAAIICTGTLAGVGMAESWRVVVSVGGVAEMDGQRPDSGATR